MPALAAHRPRSALLALATLGLALMAGIGALWVVEPGAGAAQEPFPEPTFITLLNLTDRFHTVDIDQQLPDGGSFTVNRLAVQPQEPVTFLFDAGPNPQDLVAACGGCRPAPFAIAAGQRIVVLLVGLSDPRPPSQRPPRRQRERRPAARRRSHRRRRRRRSHPAPLRPPRRREHERHEQRSALLGSGLKSEPRDTVLDVTAELDPEFENLDRLTDFLAGTDRQLIITGTGELIPSSVSPYLFKITIPDMRLEGDATPQVGGPDVVRQPNALVAFDDGTHPLISIQYDTDDAAA